MSSFQYSRRYLNQQPPQASAPDASNPSTMYSGGNRFDANVVLVLSVLLCALICSLGLNAMIRCALRCSRFSSSNSSGQSARVENKGVNKKALKSFSVVNFSADMKLPGLGFECVICLSEFSASEKIKILPICNHGFHVRCIDKWLNSHSSCPTCRHCLVDTCKKIVRHRDQASGSMLAQTPVSIARIVPLAPEVFIRNFEN